MKTLEEKIHDKGVRELYDRLLDKNYDAVLMNPIYHVGDTFGELDVLAIRGQYIHIYEYKTHHGKTQWRHAKKQLHRIQTTFPKLNAKYIYQTSEGIIRRVT